MSVPTNNLQMICYLPKWWSFLPYDGFNYHVNVTYYLGKISQERIKVGK